MSKTLTYPGLAIMTLIVVLAFVTAKSYSQLAIAVILYPILILGAFIIFPRRMTKHHFVDHNEQKLHHVQAETHKETQYISDIDKRAFIKIIGATGISFFLFSLLGRKLDPLFFGKLNQSGNSFGGGNNMGPVQSSPTDGFKISEIDEGEVSYYGFINKDGNWLIMREGSGSSSFRYAKGTSSFPDNWANRQNLNYDYFYNLF